MRLILLDFTSQICYFFGKIIFGFFIFILAHQFKGYSRIQSFFTKASLGSYCFELLKEGGL